MTGVTPIRYNRASTHRYDGIMCERDRHVYQNRLNHCPLCLGSALSGLYRIDSYTPAFSVDLCGTCGFIFMNPPFRDEVLYGFYNKAYYDGEAEYSYHDERDTRRHPAAVRDARIRTIRRYAGGGNFLDVGASFGGMLDSAEKFFTPYGIEVSPYAGEYAKSKHGGRIHVGTLDDNPFPKGFFSVITMIEVIEHIRDPRRALEECCSLLAPGGLLVIQTANMDGLQAKLFGSRYAYFMPGHCSYFTKRNLTAALKEAGFSKVKAYHPVDFGLVPKLVKSRGSFNSVLDYRKWVRIALYHWLGKIRFRGFAMTSSMVLYAFK